MKTNIATTREQSDRLLQCGVLAESADMTLRTESGEVNSSHYSLETELKIYLYDSPRKHVEICPAWSLSALLTEVLPHNISVDKYKYKGVTEYEVGYYFTGHKDKIAFNAPDPIEACVQLIEWLAENGYKLNGIEKGGSEQ